jgi:hypothetical protein
VVGYAVIRRGRDESLRGQLPLLVAVH